MTDKPAPLYSSHGLTWRDPTDGSTKTVTGGWYAELETEGRWKGCWNLSRREGDQRVRYGLHATKDKAQAAASRYEADEKQASIDAVLSLVPASGQRPEDLTGELADRIRALIHEYNGRTTLPAVIGVLQIVGYEILRDADD